MINKTWLNYLFSSFSSLLPACWGPRNICNDSKYPLDATVFHEKDPNCLYFTNYILWWDKLKGKKMGHFTTLIIWTLQKWYFQGIMKNSDILSEVCWQIMVQKYCYPLKKRFFNGKFNNIKYVYLYSTGLKADYKIRWIHLLIYEAAFYSYVFHGWEAGHFRTITGRHTLVAVSVTYPESLSDQDTGENLERIFLCKNTLAS